MSIRQSDKGRVNKETVKKLAHLIKKRNYAIDKAG